MYVYAQFEKKNVHEKRGYLQNALFQCKRKNPFSKISAVLCSTQSPIFLFKRISELVAWHVFTANKGQSG